METLTKVATEIDSPTTEIDSPTTPEQEATIPLVTVVRDENSKVKIRGACSKYFRRRLIDKTGECNITQVNVHERSRRFVADIFTTMVDIDWSLYLVFFTVVFVISWLAFAVVWWMICYAHDDLVNYQNADWQPCVREVHDYTTALLFSIETQHTIGYGSRHTTENCPEAVFVMMMQSCFGVITQALVSGVLIAKLTRPTRRAATVLFSKTAAICIRDGTLRLLVRVGDMRRSHLIGTSIRGVFVQKRQTLEGEVIPLHITDVDFGLAEGKDRLFLVWPLIVEHKIVDTSPFYDMSYDDLVRGQFELIVMVDGVVQSTSSATQALTSYLPSEIVWGYRFERLVSYQKDDGQYSIDYSRFHNTVPMDDVPYCSARDLDLSYETGDANTAPTENDHVTETIDTQTPTLIIPSTSGDFTITKSETFH